MQLRPYQEASENQIREFYSQGYKSILFTLPTGGGKTVVYGSISQKVVQKQNKVLILTHRIELLRQTSDTLDKFGVAHGIISPKFKANPLQSVQVGSVQTVLSRLKDLDKDYNIIIIDEAHHATSPSWRKVISAMHKAKILGVTATPIRSDNNGLGRTAGGLFDVLVKGPQIGELIQMGYLVKPVVYASRELLDLTDVKTTRGDFDKQQLADKMNKSVITGNAVNEYMDKCPGKPAIAFCVSVKHAEQVAADFRGRGITAASIDGKMSDDERTAVLAGLADGSIQVVTSCDLISEGTDVPVVEVAILLRPTQSLGLYLQQVGRALRLYPGKETAFVLDHAGNVMRHGLPDEDRQWKLEGSKKEDRKKQKAKPKSRPMQCQKCHVMYNGTEVCPYCFHFNEIQMERKIATVSGALEEITDADVPNIKKLQQIEVAKAETREQLEEIARKRGYKPGWVNRIMIARDNAKKAKAI